MHNIHNICNVNNMHIMNNMHNIHNLQIHTYTSTQVQKYTNIIKEHMYTSTQIHMYTITENTSPKAHNLTNKEVHKIKST